MKLTDEELTAYLHRIEVGNPDAARWSAKRVGQHIEYLEARINKLAEALKRIADHGERYPTSVSVDCARSALKESEE